MKKTTKKLSIKKETVNTFITLTENELAGVNGGNLATGAKCLISGTSTSVVSACCTLTIY